MQFITLFHILFNSFALQFTASLTLLTLRLSTSHSSLPLTNYTIDINQSPTPKLRITKINAFPFKPIHSFTSLPFHRFYLLPAMSEELLKLTYRKN